MGVAKDPGLQHVSLCESTTLFSERALLAHSCCSEIQQIHKRFKFYVVLGLVLLGKS